MTSAILQAINGVSLAALLFLLASGFTLSFGLMRVVNMAHGAYYLLGGYIGLSVARATGSFALALVAGGLAVVVLGFVVDRFLLRRTGENHLAQVLLTVGVAFVIGDVALKIWGGDFLKVPVPLALRGATELPGGLVYPTYRLVLILLGAAVGVLLWILYRKTQIGAVVRAGVDDREQVPRSPSILKRTPVYALASMQPGSAIPPRNQDGVWTRRLSPPQIARHTSPMTNATPTVSSTCARWLWPIGRMRNRSTTKPSATIARPPQTIASSKLPVRRMIE
jgi:hypothetical protein